MGKNFVDKFNAQIKPFCVVTEVFEKRFQVGTAWIWRIQLNQWRRNDQNVHKGSLA